jgi:hypothetical protein
MKLIRATQSPLDYSTIWKVPVAAPGDCFGLVSSGHGVSVYRWTEDCPRKGIAVGCQYDGRPERYPKALQGLKFLGEVGGWPPATEEDVEIALTGYVPTNGSGMTV